MRLTVESEVGDIVEHRGGLEQITAKVVDDLGVHFAFGSTQTELESDPHAAIRSIQGCLDGMHVMDCREVPSNIRRNAWPTTDAVTTGK
jgi:hypothetical protein